MTNNHSAGDLVGAIHRAYGSFSGRERQVADFVLDSPGDISMYPGSELARLVGVSNSTVTRFVQRVGFESYEDLRRAARDARSVGSPLFTLSAEAPGKDLSGRDALLAEFAASEASALHDALTALHIDEIDEITTALVKARQLCFMGFRNSHYLAAYARGRFIQFRSGTRLVPGGGESVSERIADLGPEGIAVVVAMRRVPKVLSGYVRALTRQGTRILLIADPSSRGFPADATWTITCPVENRFTFDCYSGAMAVLRLLAYLSFEKSGPAGRAYLARIEAQHDELHEFG